jgi:hypothetical protein
MGGIGSGSRQIIIAFSTAAIKRGEKSPQIKEFGSL